VTVCRDQDTMCIKTRMEGGSANLVDTVLVLLQDDIAVFSWSVSVQGKARLAGNGHSPLQEAQRSHGR